MVDFAFHVALSGERKQPLSLTVVWCRCRRATIAVHFDEVWDDEDCNEMCDICRQGSGEAPTVKK